MLPGLPPEFAQGLLAKAGAYPAVLRTSTNPCDILDDSVSTPRGLAVKVSGVEGERVRSDRTKARNVRARADQAAMTRAIADPYLEDRRPGPYRLSEEIRSESESGTDDG